MAVLLCLVSLRAECLLVQEEANFKLNGSVEGRYRRRALWVFFFQLTRSFLRKHFNARFFFRVQVSQETQFLLSTSTFLM